MALLQSSGPQGEQDCQKPLFFRASQTFFDVVVCARVLGYLMCSSAFCGDCGYTQSNACIVKPRHQVTVESFDLKHSQL
jgi:hypothetical protein